MNQEKTRRLNSYGRIKFVPHFGKSFRKKKLPPLRIYLETRKALRKFKRMKPLRNRKQSEAQEEDEEEDEEEECKLDNAPIKKINEVLPSLKDFFDRILIPYQHGLSTFEDKLIKTYRQERYGYEPFLYNFAHMNNLIENIFKKYKLMEIVGADIPRDFHNSEKYNKLISSLNYYRETSLLLKHFPIFNDSSSFPITLFRGMYRYMTIKQFENPYVENQIIDLGRITSTTLNIDIAINFSTDEVNYLDKTYNKLIFQININKPFPFSFISPASKFSDSNEYEIALPIGTRLQYKGCTTKHYEIHEELYHEAFELLILQFEYVDIIDLNELTIGKIHDLLTDDPEAETTFYFTKTLTPGEDLPDLSGHFGGGKQKKK